MTTYEKLVEGATKIKLAPPKPKYIDPILMSTADGYDSENFLVVMRTINKRLQDTAWSIVYKALIVVHIMIKEGDANVSLSYLAKHLHMFEDLKILNTHGKYISNGGNLTQLSAYDKYLWTRSKEFGRTKFDYVKKSKEARLRKLSVEKGLLREIESVQRQIDALIRCKFREGEVNNDVLILSFRMLITDLLSLYQTLNEGVLNVLEHFFELSKVDCERALKIYKLFTTQTAKVIEFLRVAKHLEHLTKLHIPTIKHAQTGLTDSLTEYLNDPYFDVNRRQYLAEQKAKGNSRSTTPPTKADEEKKAKQKLQQKNKSSSNPAPENNKANGVVISSAASANSQETRIITEGLTFQTTGYNPFVQLQQQQQLQLQQQQLPQTAMISQSQPIVPANGLIPIQGGLPSGVTPVIPLSQVQPQPQPQPHPAPIVSLPQQPTAGLPLNITGFGFQQTQVVGDWKR
ncbi:unnamed protein product [Ambrosiozyma monospora]|uniref:Unnamed protein product n=1 Tax=Ambrosiozyma monospora TaxID=43982 RepID=A0A9W6YXS2_AMBMO|nr:unnamed protein product [Ambrosiozyma monospora]